MNIRQPIQRLPNGTCTSRASGFTLLELLLVISIIALLVGILLPAIASARKLGQRTKCQANLRELAAGWHIYLDDNDGHFLQTINASILYGGGQGSLPPFAGPKPLNACLSLEPILPEGASVFTCPSDRGGGPAGDQHAKWCGTSYLMNPMLTQSGLAILPSDPCQVVLTAVSQRLPRLTRARVGPESKLLLMGDFGWGYDWDRNDPVNRARWHSARAEHNLAFMDGHAAYTRIRKGLHVTQDYHVVPFQDLVGATEATQQELPSD